jgi:tRNA (cmo5U34)-methyltransferase
MTSDSRDHMPDGKWTFDPAVGECFDDMVQRSVPLYDTTLDLLARLALPHLAGRATILDLGCSNGQALERILKVAAEDPQTQNIKAIGVDREPHMIARARTRLGATVEFVEHDLRNPLPWRVTSVKPNVVCLLWTAQFVPLEHRARIFREVRECIAPDGCLLVAEKLRGQTSRFQAVLAKQYGAWKIREGGYTREAVAKKADSLEGVLVSLSAPEQKQFMASEGWHVEEVTRYLGFASYYCLPR